MLDFPASPTTGQKYPQPPVSGQPVYTWDGEKWTTVGGTLDSGGAASALPLMDQTPALVGTATKYAREDHAHPVDSKAVRTESAQSLSGAQQQQARQNILAAPFDALAYNGLQINGGCEVNQQALGNIIPAANTTTYLTDMWLLAQGGAANMLASNEPASSFGTPAGFSRFVRTYVVGTIATLAAGDFAMLTTLIEGYRCVRLGWGAAGALPVTIGFWLFSTVAFGTVTLSLRNANGTRCYLADIAIPAANVWQYVTVTVPGDTAGTWNTTNGIGMAISVCHGCGSTYRGVNQTWNGSNVFGTAQTTNMLAATNGQVYVTGLTVLPGSEAPSAARSPFIMRPYTQELELCRRYWSATNSIAPTGAGSPSGVGSISGVATAANAMNVACKFPVRMRAAPTVTLWCNGIQNQVRDATSGAFGTIVPIGFYGYQEGVSFIVISPASFAVVRGYDFDLILDARL